MRHASAARERENVTELQSLCPPPSRPLRIFQDARGANCYDETCYHCGSELTFSDFSQPIRATVEQCFATPAAIERRRRRFGKINFPLSSSLSHRYVSP